MSEVPPELPEADEDANLPPLEVPRSHEPPPLPGERGVAAEVRSLERHVCPECGGKGEWNPGKGRLDCPYCGTEFARVAPPPPPCSIIEHDLDAMLAQLGDEAHQIDQTNRRVQCSHCHAVLVRGAEMVAQHCDFCGSPELLDYGQIDSPLQPESLLPAKKTQEQAYHSLKSFLSSKWFAPNDLKKRNLVDRIHRVYLPYWTFDSAAECPWRAQSGTYYYVTRTMRGPNGQMRTQRVRKTRWRNVKGHISTWFDDVVISGSKGLNPKILSQLEPFPTADLVPYETRYVSGWQVEQYQVPLAPAAQKAFGVMEGTLKTMCARQIPGDTYRSLRIYPEFTEKTFKHILVPIWILSYNYKGKIWHGAMNAVTGTTYAKFPISPWKVALVTLAGILALLLIIFLVGRS